MNPPDQILSENEQELLIDYHSEDIDFQLEDHLTISNWITNTIHKEDQQLTNLNFIFCSDTYLHQINIQYLNHDTLTDVITFPYSQTAVEGDIFISIDRIKENAENFAVTFHHELYRVMIHGVLHLIGYGDKTPDDKRLMTAKENEYLGQLNGTILDTN